MTRERLEPLQMDAIKAGNEGSSLDINVPGERKWGNKKKKVGDNGECVEKEKAPRKELTRLSECLHPTKEQDADSCRARLC